VVSKHQQEVHSLNSAITLNIQKCMLVH